MPDSTNIPSFPDQYRSRVVMIGEISVGGSHPVRVQSMVNTDTMDTRATVRQCTGLFDAGCEMVRITVPSKKDAMNLAKIKDQLLRYGYKQPVVADVHYVPAAAEIAAGIVEKVRINPGNYAENRSLKIFDEADYDHSLDRVREKLFKLAEICKRNHTALRVGVNHGSLSPRILERYGNTVEGMVESAMEYLRILKEFTFGDILVSLKSSHAATMIAANRLMVAIMNAEDMAFPLHLGVTEAGEGEDGRVKSALGIGTLLEEGLGDTIRVSLTGDPLDEIPFARKLAERYTKEGKRTFTHEREPAFNLYGSNTARQKRDYPDKMEFQVTKVVHPLPRDPSPESKDHRFVADLIPAGENSLVTSGLPQKKYTYTISPGKTRRSDLIVTEASGDDPLHYFRKEIRKIREENPSIPVILKRRISGTDYDDALIEATISAGGILVDGEGDGLWVEMKGFSLVELMFGILQATGRRISKAEFIACPSCGRTKFNIKSVLDEVRKRTSHLKGLKIAVMGCIVNGPGEMTGADYGYVGSGKGKVSLFRGPDEIKKNLPEADAIDELVNLIKEDGNWVPP